MKKLNLFFGFLLVVFLVACSSREVALDEPFHLKKDERVTISGEPFSILLDGVGREWDDQGEYVNASFIVRTGGAEEPILLYVGEDRILGEYLVQLVSADPFSDPNSCELIITKNE